jgi:Rrf2 family protein
MKITYRGDYALKTILDLAMHYGNGPVTIHDMAHRADIPIKFLEQILLDLKRAGFVKSRRGKIGGYILAKHPSAIKVGDVIRFIDGPIEPISCVEKKYSGCKDMHNCAFREIFKEASKATSRIVDSFNFEDLVNKIKAKEIAAVYNI